VFELRRLGSNTLVIINLRWDSIISELLNNLDVNSAKLIRKGDNLSISETNLEAEALVDEGGYGFEPSLYIIGNNYDRVCRIVEDLAKSMETMA
jgi:predicted fused transcriptional regulator/phosphomethylpyrimidine kinase